MLKGCMDLAVPIRPRDRRGMVVLESKLAEKPVELSPEESGAVVYRLRPAGDRGNRDEEVRGRVAIGET
jgi:hypothetical protein